MHGEIRATGDKRRCQLNPDNPAHRWRKRLFNPQPQQNRPFQTQPRKYPHPEKQPGIVRESQRGERRGADKRSGDRRQIHHRRRGRERVRTAPQTRRTIHGKRQLRANPQHHGQHRRQTGIWQQRHRQQQQRDRDHAQKTALHQILQIGEKIRAETPDLDGISGDQQQPQQRGDHQQRFSRPGRCKPHCRAITPRQPQCGQTKRHTEITERNRKLARRCSRRRNRHDSAPDKRKIIDSAHP